METRHSQNMASTSAFLQWASKHGIISQAKIETIDLLLLNLKMRSRSPTTTNYTIYDFNSKS